eukprot:TRINITY_DN719_c0_g1_i1.p1 TRINITY_DN719_c0_g1~~TRINITY_DN719_c0_g1_i1.p1  ORF type:complete len:525 (+),score=101.65 TRINITY_DN719_c0_g1_i1:2-1576(+)
MDDQKLFASMMAQMAQNPDLGFGPQFADGPDINLDDYDNMGRKKSEQPIEPVFSVEKDIISPGSGEEYPTYGAKATVEVDGVVQEVIIGNRKASVSKAVMEGMKTLKKGEEATVRVFQSFPKPEKPKAEAQKGSKAPQITESESSTAVVPSEETTPVSAPEKELLGSWKLKLIDFENVELITTDRGIYKKILRPHNPDQPLKDRKPEFESNARFYIRIQLENGQKVYEDQLSYVIGEESTVPRVEKCLRSMRWGEVGLFVLHPFYGYGDEGNQELGIPPNSTLHYTIELLGFDVPMSPFQCSTFDQCFPEAFKRKEEGNAFFRKKLYDLATAKYTKAQLFAECAEREKLTEEQLQKLDQVKLHCSCNLAFVTLRNREFEKTLIHCKAALDIDPTNMKALYRRGLVYVYQDKWTEARSDFDSILAREPNNSDTLRAVAFLEAKIRHQQEREARMFKRVFQQIESEDKAEAKAATSSAATKELTTPKIDEPVESEPEEDSHEQDPPNNGSKGEQKSIWKRLFSWWS